MDKNVTVKLFSMERAREETPRFIDAIRAIDNIDGYENRERAIAPGFQVRLEFLDEENDHVVSGELTRIQTTNFPSEITPAGRTALNVNNRLGHSVVFRANHHRGVIAIEYNNRVCSPGRLFSYLQEFSRDAVYNVLPIVREEAWERYNRAGPRKLQVAVASPSDLRVLEGDGRAVGEAIAAMGEAYLAPKITVEIAMGHAPGQLSTRLTGLVREFLRRSASEEISLQKLKVFNPDFPEGIDFLDEFLIFRETLDLHDRDPDVNFGIKRDFLRRVMNGI
ncbi:hypothetical protein [Methylobacterium sp. D54C]